MSAEVLKTFRVEILKPIPSDGKKYAKLFDLFVHA